MRIRTLVAGGALGAAIAYYFDPVSGRGRRSRLRDQAMARLRDAREQAQRRARHASDVERGRLAATAPQNVATDDGTLEARIRSTVFGSPDVPSDRLTIEVVSGSVTLRGEVASSEQALDVAEQILLVPGVLEVLVLVHRPGELPPNKADAIRVSHDAEATIRRVNPSAGHVTASEPHVEVPEPPSSA